jgi:hypothetical protein
MGVDTNVMAFDEGVFAQLSLAFETLAQNGDARALEKLIVATPDSIENIRDAALAFASNRNAGALIALRAVAAVDIASRLFFGLCSPASLSLTSSSFIQYLYNRSPLLLQLFTVGGLDGITMDLYLGPGATLLNPLTAERMWTEILSQLPVDKSHFLKQDVENLMWVDQKINKQSYTNVCVAWL